MLRAISSLASGGTFNNPTFTGVSKGEPYIVYESAIPFICLSSGSVSAAGAITGITALRIAYPNAYCYFPANALATTIAAGWYYCRFSTTTAGTAFLNTYTSGQPSIPASPTAVTDGNGAFTGVTTEIAGPTASIAANAMGVSGSLDYVVEQSFTNSAGAKFSLVRYSGAGGTNLTNFSLTTQLGNTIFGRIRNRGVASVQTANWYAIDYGQVLRAASSPSAMTVDTTAASTLVAGMQRNTATDNFVTESMSVVLRINATNG